MANVRQSTLKLLFANIGASLILVGQPAIATSQEPDQLVLEGEKLSLETNPLSPLIEAGRIALPEPAERWSSNWRGYVATWTVEGNQLFLEQLDVLLRQEGASEGAEAAPTDVLSRVFPGQAQVPATWFSGALIVPRGRSVRYVNMGYGSTHERYTVLRIESGRVVSRSDLNASEFEKLRKEKFAAYQQTLEYASRFKEARENLSKIDAEEFLYQYAVEEYMAIEP